MLHYTIYVMYKSLSGATHFDKFCYITKIINVYVLQNSLNLIQNIEIYEL